MAISHEKGVNSGSGKPVHDRLLDAAEKLFCEHGFEGASIRDIAAAADCNIASVNYYFGGKDKLYVEVWRRHLLPMSESRIASIDRVMSKKDDKPRLEDLLKSFADAFIEPMLDESKAGRLAQLMAWEMLDQHLPLDTFVEEMIKPTMTAMQRALVKACPSLEESKVPLFTLSVVGQLMHVVHIKAMFKQTDIAGLPKFDLTEAVNHIVKFSAAGIRACVEGKTE